MAEHFHSSPAPFPQLPCSLEYSSPPTLSTALQRPLDERGAQGAESQHLKQDAYLPRHACISANHLIFSELQNTLLQAITYRRPFMIARLSHEAEETRFGRPSQFED